MYSSEYPKYPSNLSYVHGSLAQPFGKKEEGDTFETDSNDDQENEDGEEEQIVKN